MSPEPAGPSPSSPSSPGRRRRTDQTVTRRASPKRCSARTPSGTRQKAVPPVRTPGSTASKSERRQHAPWKRHAQQLVKGVMNDERNRDCDNDGCEQTHAVRDEQREQHERADDQKAELVGEHDVHDNGGDRDKERADVAA